MEAEFQFNHKEAVKYVKAMLKSFNIGDYKTLSESYDTEDEYYPGSKNHHDYTKIYNLPAPYFIGNIKIEIMDASVSFRLTMDGIEKLTKKQKELYKVDFFEISDNIWNIMLPDYSLSDRNIELRTGYNFGNYIDENTIRYFNNLFTIIFGGNYKTNYLVKLAANSYANNREILNFIELAAHAWNMNPTLWKCINIFGTQAGEITRTYLENQYEDLKCYD